MSKLNRFDQRQEESCKGGRHTVEHEDFGDIITITREIGKKQKFNCQCFGHWSNVNIGKFHGIKKKNI